MNTTMPGRGLTPQSSSPVIIAGKNAGRPIYCAPGLAAEVKKLEDAYKRGSHWARVAIKELHALTSGHLGKKNVFIEESPHLRRNVVQGQTQSNPHIKHSITLFYAFLPGLKATIAQRPDGSYFVLGMVLDGRYTEATDQEQPGLYEIRKRNSLWTARHVPAGKVKSEKNRPVAIADMCYASPEKAADAVAPCLTKVGAPIDGISLDRDGFDLLFTPGKRRIGGLVQYGAMPIESAHGASVQLAYSMASARSISRVNWIAENGGSAILTQSMKVLASRGVALKGHSLYLYHPRTSLNETTRLAHQLELTLSEDFAKVGFDVVGGISKSRVAQERLSAPTDRYNLTSHRKARMVTAGKVVTVAGLGVAAGGVMGGTFPMVAAITTALSKVTGAASVAIGAGAVAEHVLQPHKHKLKGLGKKKG